MSAGDSLEVCYSSVHVLCGYGEGFSPREVCGGHCGRSVVFGLGEVAGVPGENLHRHSKVRC